MRRSQREKANLLVPLNCTSEWAKKVSARFGGRLPARNRFENLSRRIRSSAGAQKSPLSRAFFPSGRRDLNSGPLVPRLLQRSGVVCPGVASSRLDAFSEAGMCEEIPTERSRRAGARGCIIAPFRRGRRHKPALCIRGWRCPGSSRPCPPSPRGAGSRWAQRLQPNAAGRLARSFPPGSAECGSACRTLPGSDASSGSARPWSVSREPESGAPTSPSTPASSNAIAHALRRDGPLCASQTGQIRFIVF